MTVYTDSIRTALVLFPLLAALLTVPYLLWQYHRYGAVSPLRSAVLCSFVFYLLCAYFLVILPLPSREEAAAMTGPRMQWMPLSFVGDMARYSSFRLFAPETWLGALSERVVLEPVFNVLLTLPFGAYVAYYFGGGHKRTVLLTFALTLFFELTQLSGLYGFYPRPYRLFDVDDLLLNTLGGALGWYVGVWAASFLPSRRRMDWDSLRRSEQVGYMRRLAAALVDGLVVLAAGWAICAGGLSPVLGFPLVYFLYFVGLQSILGRTPGKALVHIRLYPLYATHPLWQHLLTRYVLMLAVPAWGLLSLSLMARGQPWLMVMVMMSDIAVALLLVGDVAQSLSRGKRMWQDRLCGMTYASTLVWPVPMLPAK